MSGHTPGPWFADGDRIDSEYRSIAEVCPGSLATRRADARLIAESPTLLALLRECLANSPGRTSYWRSRVEESIARIEGRTP